MIMNDHRKIIKVLFSRMANTRRITSLKMLPECTKLYKKFSPKIFKGNTPDPNSRLILRRKEGGTDWREDVFENVCTNASTFYNRR